jgi:hypothetical protein
LKRSFIFIAAVFSLCFFLNPASLQAVGVAQVDQAKVRLIIAPGGTKTGSIRIDNPSPESKQIKVYLEDWVYLPVCDGTKDFKSAGTADLSASSWVNFSPSEFTLSSYGQQVVNYTVKVPKEAQGGHYTVMFFENYLGTPEKDSGIGVNVNLAIRVASLFYIEVEGTVKRDIKISNFDVSKKDEKLQVSLKLDNIGNVDVSTTSTFFILDKKGAVTGRGQFNDVYTLPGDSVMLTSSWKEPIPEGVYDLVLSIDIGKALEDAGLGRVPVITKEATIEIGSDGNVINVGELK